MKQDLATLIGEYVRLKINPELIVNQDAYFIARKLADISNIYNENELYFYDQTGTPVQANLLEGILVATRTKDNYLVMVVLTPTHGICIFRDYLFKGYDGNNFWVVEEL
jgi:hypothetical protein